MSILDEYLMLHDPAELEETGWIRESTLSAAVRDARNVSGRGTPGKVDPAGAHAWIGAVAWLCLIDQLGQAVRHRDDQPLPGIDGVGARFERVLRRFSKAKPSHRGHLWSLRCSLAHNYSLCNTVDNPPTVFALHAQSPDIQQLMKQSTSGGLTRVRVDLMALGSLGEQIVKSVQRAHREGLVRPGVRDEDEFNLRFFMDHGTDPPADRVQEFVDIGILASASPPVSGWGGPASKDEGEG